MRALLIDDNDIDRKILRECLAKAGFDVIDEAEDGGSGLFKFQNAVRLKEKIDLIIVDWKMPEKSGLMVLKTVRQTFSKTELPVIMVTAVSGKDSVQDALKAGVNEFILKPVQVRMVVEKLTNLASCRKA